jgi:hypothetical protein
MSGVQRHRLSRGNTANAAGSQKSILRRVRNAAVRGELPSPPTEAAYYLMNRQDWRV